MDNYTLLVTLIIILGINVPFSVGLSHKTEVKERKDWRSSSLLLFSGFLLILFQKSLPVFVTVCIANYLILLGFFYQVTAALSVEFEKRVIAPSFLAGLSLIYWISFVYYGLIRFHTPMRIIIISLFLTLIYLHAVIPIYRKRRRLKDMVSWELFLLFLISALFYLMRSIVTAIGTGAVSSLFDPSLLTTVSFLFVTFYNLAFIMSMFNATLKKKNREIIREKEKQESLFNFLNDTARHLNLDELYKSIEEVLKSALGVGTALIYLRDEGRESHSLAYHFKDLNVPLEDVSVFNRGEGASGRAIEEDRVIVIGMKDYPIRAVVDNYIPLGVAEVISVPLKTPEGIIGAVSLILTEKKKSRHLDQDFFYYLGEQIGLVLHNAFLYERVSAMANTDPLTGLSNRRRMMEILKQEDGRARRHGRTFSLIMADLDHFKRINDTYGHDCGDEVLKAAASLITGSCRDIDTICRWGGEEFLILLLETDAAEAVVTMERLRDRMKQLILPCLEEDGLTISMGVSSFRQDLDIEKMISRADEALYMAKRNGRNRTEVI